MTTSHLVHYAEAAYYDEWRRYYQSELAALWQCLQYHLQPGETIDRDAFEEWILRHSTVERETVW